MMKRSGLVIALGLLLAPVAALAQMAPPTQNPTPPMMGHDAGMAPPPSGNHMGPNHGGMQPTPPPGHNGMRPAPMHPPAH